MNFKAIVLSVTLLFFSLHASDAPGYTDIVDQSKLQILTPSLACQETAKIRLNNGLEALLISDPEGNQSAAALVMHVGSWDNPPEYPGIAHFLEHLLFLGSETYPEEDGYMKHVSNNGGTVNAYTAHDHTAYIFSVNHDAFASTLDYFAHMFIDPLFTPSGIGRELRAVDQEYDKNIESDGFRQYMILKATGNQEHPNAQFATGNSETLGGIPRKEVMQWYEDNYSSDKAHLVVYSALPIDELKEMTSTIFSAIPRRSSSNATQMIRLSSSTQEGSIAFIQPVKELRNLCVLWEMPQELMGDIDNKSPALIAYVLSSRHPGSLYDTLKKDGFIDDLSAGRDPYSKDSGYFYLEFNLTPKGVEEYETVLTTVFETINGLKLEGIPPYLQNELNQMSKLDYAYQGRIHPYRFVSNLGKGLNREPIETFPDRLILASNFDAKKVELFLALLSPETAHYHLMAPSNQTKIATEQTEPWTQAEYTLRRISPEQLAAWSQANPSKEHSLIPEPNQFIPTDLRLVARKAEKTISPTPECLVDNEFGKVYYWKDDQYLVPEVSWRINIRSPILDRGARQIPVATLARICLYESLEKITSYASAAGLSFSCSEDIFRLTLEVDGYSEKAPTLLQAGLEAIHTCSWSEEEFLQQKSMLIDSYQNFSKVDPVKQGVDLLRHLIFNTSPRKHEQLEELKTVSYEEFQDFQNKLFESAYVEMLLAGNLTKKEAYSVWDQVSETLRFIPYPKDSHYEKRVLVLPENAGPFKVSESLSCLGNAAFLAIQEGPFTFDKWASSAVLAKGLSMEFFETLRTKQQTGYITSSAHMETHGQLLQYFLVQSTTHEPDELIARFELFLEGYVNDFDTEFSVGKFENVRQTLIDLEMQPPSNLASMANYLDTLAFDKRGDFQRSEKKIEALKALDYETFKTDCIEFLSRRNSKRIAISLTGAQPEEKSFRYKQVTVDALKSEGAYITWEK